MKTMRQLFGLAAALHLIGPSLVTELRAAAEGATSVTVEVLIFSGRPNPTWQLQDTNRLQQLITKLKELPEAFKEEPPGWSRLGFAGFRVHGGEVWGLSAEIRIYQGVIKTGHGKGARYLRDLEGLEQRLIAEAKRQALDPPVKHAIVNYEIARKAAH
jgi:hypothetical protein